MHQFVKDPCIIERLRRGELGDHIDSYAALLSQQNYAASSAYGQLLVISRFSQWLQRRGIEVHRVDENTLQKFLRPIPRKMRFQSGDAAALNRLLRPAPPARPCASKAAGKTEPATTGGSRIC